MRWSKWVGRIGGAAGSPAPVAKVRAIERVAISRKRAMHWFSARPGANVGRTVRVLPVEIPAAWRGVPAAGCSILVKMIETLTGPQYLDIRRMILPSRPRMTVGEGTELTVERGARSSSRRLDGAAARRLLITYSDLEDKRET